MSVETNNTTIITFKGDTCTVTFTDLEEGMVIYFAVRDKKTNSLVFDELHDTVDSEGEITFTITPEMSNEFEVKPSEGYNTYYYGIKQVDEITGEENTILLGDNPKFSDKYLIKVYLKKAEGIVEDNG
jgi:hypothetical protein